MWKIVLGVIFAAAFLAAEKTAEKYDGLQLPTARHIVGMVVDADGQPIAEASIDHTGIRHQAFKTDSAGRFTLDTKAPALVIRKPGFRSELVHTPGAADVRVTLQKLSDRRTFPTCADTEEFDGIEGWDAAFQFPKIPGVKAARQVTDADYGARTYYVKTKRGRRRITHGSGSFWSWGKPLDSDVWRSVKYEESSLVAGAQTILDARGQFSNGNHWRTLGKFGESAFYSDVDDATAKLLDQVLDGACLKPAQRR